MKFTTVATLLLTAATQLVSAYPITAADVVNCRSGPGTSHDVVKTYKLGEDVQLTCQTEGENVRGDSLWDKTTDGCFVADFFVQTGTGNYVAGKCDGGSTNPPPPPPPSGDDKVPGPMGDDYPYPNQCDGVDPWNYYKCQCVSFVAWRINSRLGIKFHNRYKGAAWGNANEWDDAARATGVTIDDNPVPGAVGQTNTGSALGHVTWVASVAGDSVTIEEYNYKRFKYGTRTVPKSSFSYIHLKA
ncbi:hypothetical protein GGI12_005041 [Dipsacomyces acuminosporus]|nr:hypothetical protein GGI12_005041 [Dipsacomyces acuminosporus]